MYSYENFKRFVNRLHVNHNLRTKQLIFEKKKMEQQISAI